MRELSTDHRFRVFVPYAEEEITDIKDGFKKVTKAVQTFRGIAVEFLPKKISVGTISTVLLGTTAPKIEGAINEVVTEKNKNDKGDDMDKWKWNHFPVKLESEAGGAATLKFRVQLFN